MPSTPFMGVRISWLMFATNSVFARLAASAASASSCVRRIADFEALVGGFQFLVGAFAAGTGRFDLASVARGSPGSASARGGAAATTQLNPASVAATSVPTMAASRPGVHGDGVFSTTRSSGPRRWRLKPVTVRSASDDHRADAGEPHAAAFANSARDGASSGAIARNVDLPSSSVSTVASWSDRPVQHDALQLHQLRVVGTRQGLRRRDRHRRWHDGAAGAAIACVGQRHAIGSCDRETQHVDFRAGSGRRLDDVGDPHLDATGV